MKHHALVVDDEADVRSAIRLQLKGSRFEVLEAENVDKAIAILADNPISIDVIVCDVRMPGKSGVDAVNYFLQEYPNTPVVVLTGFPDVALAVDFMKKKNVVDFLTKPVDRDKLVATVERAAQGRKLFE
ncbi:MAG: response regulator [Betaproteobacteria bacterium]|nr:response regulator [Betaproteobacteria bacterium]MDH4322758.1 response regulator [Betaproteobacteria bacterium]MDH5211578.1 response regulator [Betaproteobacteria bacterium]